MTLKLKLEIANDTDAVEIGRLYRKASKSIVMAVCDWWRCGERLTWKKAQPGMSACWLRWLAANADTLGFGERAAQQLIQFARENPQPATDIPLEEALRLNRNLWGHDGPVRGTAGTGENEWHTPLEYLDLAREVLGEFDLDPASSDRAQVFVRAKKYFTKKNDGLSKDWFGNVWLNPPYAQPLISDFVGKLISEIRLKRVRSAILLTHNYTDTSWFQSAVRLADSICFTNGRVRFVDPDGNEAAPTQGQAFSYFGSDVRKFARVFFDVGFTVTPIWE